VTALAELHFLRPQWLWLVLPTALVVWLFHWRDDPERPWRGLVASHLLPHLLVGRGRRFGLRPVHGVALFLLLCTLAVAGPTWQREPPPFVQDKAPLVVALDLSRTMDAIDVSPSRLERGKQKIRDLLTLRQGARTALLAYAGSAHLVLPLTEDRVVLETYLEALGTGLMPKPGKDSARALELGESLLAKEPVAGTILFVTDGISSAQVPAFAAHTQKSRTQVVVLGVGTSEGGPVRDGKGFLTEGGRRVVAKLDREGLETLARTAGAFVATATLDDRDVARIQREVQTHMVSAVQHDPGARYRDFGWYLTPVLALLGALWFRRGFSLRWASALVLGALLPAPARASDWRVADLVATRDQQGRYFFQKGDYKTAAQRFRDPMWKGIACYRAGDYACAVDAFARVDSPDAYYNLGNAYAEAGELELALGAYDKALAGRPAFSDARANRDLVASLVPGTKKKDEEEGKADPNQKPDDVQLDDKGKKGKAGKVEVRQLTDEEIARMWLRGVETSPAGFLKMKFAAQEQALRDGRAGTGGTGGTGENRH
jgi:Ca-activated chloride channel family protein